MLIKEEGIDESEFNSIKKQILINCWNCATPVLLKHIQEADGYCPDCGAPIDLEDEELSE